MPPDPRPAPSARRRVTGRRPGQLLGAVVLAGITLAGCSAGDDGAAAPAQSESGSAASASPSPSFELRPVDGEVDAGQIGVESSLILSGQPTAAPDQDGIDTMVAATKRWLDTHLDRLQRHRRGMLGRTAPPALIEATSSALRDAVSIALASPERPVDAARYEIRVYYDPGPRWASAHVTTRAPDGSTAEASFTFLPNEPVVPILLSADTPTGRETAGTPPDGTADADSGEDGG